MAAAVTLKSSVTSVTVMRSHMVSGDHRGQRINQRIMSDFCRSQLLPLTAVTQRGHRGALFASTVPSFQTLEVMLGALGDIYLTCFPDYLIKARVRNAQIDHRRLSGFIKCSFRLLDD